MMANPSKAKGTQGETACVRWFQDHGGFPMADRQPLRGNRDTGDIALCPGIVVEVKAYRLATGYPTAGQLETWLDQCAVEKANAGAAYCPLIVKRPGTTDVSRWFAFLPLGDFAMLTGALTPLEADDQAVQLTVAALALVFRAAGYGTPLNEVYADLAWVRSA
ncbi:hypothetical protein GCM10027053_51730 [Intrasporangium mesophilum]